MWLFTPDAMVSIVQLPTEEGPTRLQVRARSKLHLISLGFKSEEVIHTESRDYQYRVIVSRERVGRLMMSLVNMIDYGNFKDKAADSGSLPTSMLHSVWQAGFDALDERSWK